MTLLEAIKINNLEEIKTYDNLEIENDNKISIL
mgnify:CR=1 FL=1